MPRIVNLIAGYRRTGKDTLHNDLVHNTIVYRKNGFLPLCDYTWIPLWMMFMFRMVTIGSYILIEMIKHMREQDSIKAKPRWLVFSNRTNAIHAHQEYLFVTCDRQQAAFARVLKQDVHEWINKCLNGKECLTDAWFEQNKDQKLRMGDIITSPRELYISRGEGAKREDPIIWVRKCFDSFACKKDNQHCVRGGELKTESSTPAPGDSEIVDITDWRFPCEQIYAMLYKPIYRIFTTRIYRSVVNVPNDESEHGLDHVTTDLLLVPDWLDMIIALIRWPQYARHMHIGSLCPK